MGALNYSQDQKQPRTAESEMQVSIFLWRLQPLWPSQRGVHFKVSTVETVLKSAEIALDSSLSALSRSIRPEAEASGVSEKRANNKILRNIRLAKKAPYSIHKQNKYKAFGSLCQWGKTSSIESGSSLRLGNLS